MTKISLKKLYILLLRGETSYIIYIIPPTYSAMPPSLLSIIPITLAALFHGARLSYSRRPKKRANSLLFSATVFCTPTVSTRLYASMHTRQLLSVKERNASTVFGNPGGAATAGGIIGAMMVSSSRVARALNTLASARIALASVRIPLASKGAKAAAKAAAMAGANHGGAMCSPEKR